MFSTLWPTNSVKRYSQEVRDDGDLVTCQDLHPATHHCANLHRNGDDERAAHARVLRVLRAFAQLVCVSALGLVRALRFVEGHVSAIGGIDGRATIVCTEKWEVL